LDELDLPIGLVEVGSLFEGAIILEIPSCGEATLVEHDGVRHINPSHGCGPLTLRQLHDEYNVKLQQPSKKLKMSVEDLKRQDDRVLPGPHSCQVGTLSLGWPRLAKKHIGAKDDRPPWIVRAEKSLTRYPYSLLFSFLSLVQEQTGKSTLDDWVPVERALAWCSQYGLPLTEEQRCMDCGGECLRLEVFQWEVVLLYLLFRLWKALVDWEVFLKAGGPYHPGDINAYRDAIHRYAMILLGPAQARSRSLFASDRMLDHAIRKEYWLRRQSKGRLARGEAYEKTQAEVGYLAQTYISEIVTQRCGVKLAFFFQVQRVLPKAQSVFDLCYLQLSQLMLKPLHTWVRHLRLCEVPPCGRLFWAPHGHNKYCEEHLRGGVWAEKSRKSQT
jgi:hypothetical protein